MKYFLLIFLFLLFSCSRTQENGEIESGYTPLDNSQVTSNPQLQGLLFIGVQNVTQQAIQDGSLPEGNYQVSQIISAAQNQDDYRFEIEVTDDQGNTADILFFITYNSYTGTTEVTSYDVLGDEEGETTGEIGEVTEVTEIGEVTEVTELGEVTEIYEIGEGEQTEDGFVILDPSVAQTDTEIAGILNVGVQEVVKLAIANGSLYDSPYELAAVYSVQQNIANPNQYRFDLSVRNSLMNVVVMAFDLVYDESSNTVEILSWGYPNTILPVKGVEIVPGGVDEIPASYQEIAFDLNDRNSFVYMIGDAALQVVVTTGFLEGTIPTSYYVATNVHSVSTKFEEGKLYYRFDLDADDDYGNSARFTYVVSVDQSTSVPHLEEMKISNVVRAT